MMKAVVCAALLLLVTCPGDALKCNYCSSKSTDPCVPSSTQTCRRPAKACGAFIIRKPLKYSFRGCISMTLCRSYNTWPGSSATCCSTDLCN